MRTSENRVNAKFVESTFRGLRWTRATKAQKRLELAAKTAVCHASSRTKRRKRPRNGKVEETEDRKAGRWRSFGPIRCPVRPSTVPMTEAVALGALRPEAR
jgi:hypothetical protein